eukprot:6606057-Prymnesium_polylepis.1
MGPAARCGRCEEWGAHRDRRHVRCRCRLQATTHDGMSSRAQWRLRRWQRRSHGGREGRF